jgi:hypothetical protein
MSPPARPIKVSFRIRRNFKSRDWTSIGLRGARVSSGYARTRTKPGSSGRGSGDAHIEESRVVGFTSHASTPPLDAKASPRRDWRELLWTALIALAIAAAAAIHMMQ